MMAATLLSKVRCGAALLDTLRPRWATSINPATLEMGSSCFCILGQLYGHYFEGKYAVGLNNESSNLYGFTTTDSANWSNLNTLWKAEVAARVAVDVG